MTSDTYQLLHELSLSRVEREWSLSDAERSVMRAMVRLSYGEGQSWALIPCQQKLATALRVHKATVCRSIASCIRLGILEMMKRRDETLYRVMPNADGVPMNSDTESEKAMQELHELQRVRLRGEAEASGQMRIPGLLPSEEIDAPAEAFTAAMSLSRDEPQSKPAKAPDDESDEDFHRRLERIVRATGANAPAEPTAATTSITAEIRTPGAMAPRSAESTWAGALRKLSPKQQELMEKMRAEARSTNRTSEADFVQWCWRWKSEVQKRKPRLLEELTAEHKYFRLAGKPWESFGKFLNAQLKKIDERDEIAALNDTS